MAKQFILSDHSINSYGFVVLTAGIDLARFKKNPVMLYMHDKGSLIGKWTALKVEGDQLIADPVFNTKNTLAAEKAQEVEDGFLNGVSIGLTPLEVESGDKHGFPKDVPVVTKCILLEASLCPLPSNGDALALYDRDGNVLNDAQIQELKLSYQNKPAQMSNLTAIAKQLGLPETATEQEVLAAMVLQKEQNTQLAAQASEQKAARVKQLVDGGVAAGKFTAAEVPMYTALANADLENTTAIIGKMQALKKPIDLINQNAAASGVAGDRSTWSFKDWSKNDPTGLKELQLTNVEAYDKLVEDFKTTVQKKPFSR